MRASFHQDVISPVRRIALTCFAVFELNRKRCYAQICKDKEDDEESISSVLSSSEICMLEAVKRVDRFPLVYAEQEVRASGRRSRQPVITRVLDLNLLDDTYAGVTKTLLSKCSSWSFNTFNLDVSTGGRSLSYLLVHLFQEYGFVKAFRLDIVKVWHCFNLMEAAYHRHNPYHNSVHAADVTQAMHCFLQESKFAAHLTPLEAMSSVIAAVAHDLDHPGVTQAFLVATSNHLVNLYHNSSVLENHHWRTAISCLSESGIFSHLDKEVWQDIQNQIRSLILATDITRQKEFLARFKSYLNSECLDMEKTQYRHFALQIALKCADLCNPCRPWAISQRWSYQVCQEFYRQGAYEKQLKLPLTPTFDCSRTKVAKIQVDFFQFVVSPLFETWDHFLKTPLSSKLLENLRHNYSQWQKRIEIIQQSNDIEDHAKLEEVPEIKVDSCSVAFEALPLSGEDNEENQKQLLSIDSDVVLKQHRSKSDSGLTPRLLSPKIHMETYSTEELHPSTTLLSLSSITNTVQLRQVYAATKVESHLICPTVFQPLCLNTCTKGTDIKKSDSVPVSENCSKKGEDSSLNEDGNITDTSAQSSVAVSCPDGCGTPSPPEKPPTSQFCKTKQRSHSLISESESLKYYSQMLQNRRASDFGLQNQSKASLAPKYVSPVSNNQPFCEIQRNREKQMPSVCNNRDDTAIKSFCNNYQKDDSECFTSSRNCSSKHCTSSTCNCETESYKKIPSWCWHISRSFSAERPVRPSLDFDSPLPAWQGSSSSLTNRHNGRRGSAPVPVSFTADSGNLSNTGDVDPKNGLKGGSEISGASGRRWSIPVETIADLQMIQVTKNSADKNSVPLRFGRRSSFGLLEPLLAMSDSENSLKQSCSPSLKPIHRSCHVFSRNDTKDELNEHTDCKSVTNSDSFLSSFSSSHQASVQRRGSLPTEVPIALMCHVDNPSLHLRNKISSEKFTSKESSKTNSSQHSSFLFEHARRHGSPSDLLSVLIGPSGMLNTMHGIVSGQTICECPRPVAQENSRRRSGGLEMLSGLWRSRTNDMAVSVGMATKLKLRRQLLEDWASWRTEEGNVKPPISSSSSISALGHQFRRGSVPLNISLLSLSSENTLSGEQAD
ncbi:uncharacterized protein LOC118189173 isoform X2 [Stegodyphus dumicola]|uniref:uncharacterized protein LOC118189173 isoform X2 n=1 Tax=Stegodyphus dumicola TaxID=202533 RepID=UPI0015AE493A|nr:uncharacterized protein LOC118189173 isoform X2 [Stegodyphus dumicola]